MAPPCSPLQPTTAVHQASLETRSCITSVQPSSFSGQTLLSKFKAHQSHPSGPWEPSLFSCAYLHTFGCVKGAKFSFAEDTLWNTECTIYSTVMCHETEQGPNKQGWFFSFYFYFYYFSCETSILDMLMSSRIFITFSFTDVLGVRENTSMLMFLLEVVTLGWLPRRKII